MVCGLRRQVSVIGNVNCKVQSANFVGAWLPSPYLLEKGARDYRQHLNVIARHGIDRLADVGQPTPLKKGVCNEKRDRRTDVN